jgi:Domain of unknown function (DUF4166)
MELTFDGLSQTTLTWAWASVVMGDAPRFRCPDGCRRGTTQVEHHDEPSGWSRFTLTVTHPLFGEMFHQTGRFHAARRS